MDTTASVTSSPAAPWQAPQPRARKKATANIFKDIDLLQLQTLFRTNGDECAEERAHIVYNYPGDRRIADALLRLRRKTRKCRSSHIKLSNDGIEELSLESFNKLCINEDVKSGEEKPAEPISDPQDKSGLCSTKRTFRIQRTWDIPQPVMHSKRDSYLHQINGQRKQEWKIKPPYSRFLKRKK